MRRFSEKRGSPSASVAFTFDGRTYISRPPSHDALLRFADASAHAVQAWAGSGASGPPRGLDVELVRLIFPADAVPAYQRLPAEGKARLMQDCLAHRDALMAPAGDPAGEV